MKREVKHGGCKTFNNEDRQIIIDLKNEFSDDSIESVRDVLQTVNDSCHYCKFFDHLVDTEEETSDESPGLNPPEEKKGHPFHVYRTVALVDCVCIIPF